MDQGERSLRRQEDFHAIQTLRLTRSKDNELFSGSHCAAAASSLDKQERGGED